MRRFWSDLLASLYNIRDGIVKKKQELDEERAACEEEKEELRGQITELEEELVNNQNSLIEQPVAMYIQEGERSALRLFDTEYAIQSNPAYAYYKKDQFDYDENSGTYSLKEGKIYIGDNGGASLYGFDNVYLSGISCFCHIEDHNDNFLIIPVVNIGTGKYYNPYSQEYNLNREDLGFYVYDLGEINVEDLIIIIPTNRDN